MRPSPLLLALLLGATPACKPQIPNPVDVAQVAVEGTFMVLDETGRAVRAARRASAEAQRAPGNGTPGDWAPPGAPPLVMEPPGGRIVQAQLSGEDGESQWLVQSGGEELLSRTPCTLQYPTGTGVSLVQVPGSRKQPRLALPYLQGGSYDVQARPRNNGAFAPGVIFASFGGMGTLAGLVVTAVGCGQGDGGMCKGGGITFGVSSAVLTGGIILVAVSGAKLLVSRKP